MDYFITVATNVIIASLILMAGWMLGNYVYKIIQNIKKLDDTLKSFLGAIAKYAILTLAGVMILQQFGVQIASLLAILAAAGLAIGLALQGTLSNVSAGVMLLILRPFDVGDFISCGGTTGTVKSLGLFVTELSTSENVYIFVPNSKLWNTDIKNFSRHDTRRQDLIFGISYNDDINKAFKTIENTISKDERIFTDEGKAPKIMVTNLGDSSVDITLRIWSDRGDVASIKVDTMKAIKEALDRDGISIPFPTRTIEMVQPANEAVKAAPKAKVAAKKKAA